MQFLCMANWNHHVLEGKSVQQGNNTIRHFLDTEKVLSVRTKHGHLYFIRLEMKNQVPIGLVLGNKTDLVASLSMSYFKG